MSEEIIAETMRLELAPFGVKVLSVVSGALQTMGQTHFDDWKLPVDSLYMSVEETIRTRARGQEGAPRMDPGDYAKRVVSEITAGRAGKFWYGASAGVVKFSVSYLPTWLMVRHPLLPRTSTAPHNSACTIADMVSGRGSTNEDWARCSSQRVL